MGAPLPEPMLLFADMTEGGEQQRQGCGQKK